MKLRKKEVERICSAKTSNCQLSIITTRDPSEVTKPKMATPTGPTSPVTYAFPHIQWDALGSLRLTAQETALLRMAETNPIDYTLADSRDASMYARVLLKLLAEASSAGAGSGKI